MRSRLRLLLRRVAILGMIAGTAHARDRLREALGADRVTDLVCPPQFGPGGAR